MSTLSRRRSSPAHRDNAEPVGFGWESTNVSTETAIVQLSRDVTAYDPARVLRAKALLCTAPVHDLQRNRGRRGWERFDLNELALAAIDIVVDAMVDSGMSVEDLRRALASRAREQVECDVDTARAVADEVISALVRLCSAEYVADEEGRRRTFSFRLLEEHEADDGAIYLKATNEAINVIVGALDVDPASAQEAAETTLERMLARRRYADAAVSARAARLRSIQYANFVRELIKDTRRDVRRAGWREGIAARLDEIRQHLSERMDVERRVLDNVRDARDAAEREDLRQHAARLVESVADCFARHTELHKLTLEAVPAYIEERDRQTFVRVVLTDNVDLTDDVLLPLLAAPIESALPPLITFASALHVPVGGRRGSRWRQLELSHALGVLLRDQRPAHEDESRPLEGIEWADGPIDPLAFDGLTSAEVDALLEGLDVPHRLSTLLGRAASSDARELLRIRALLAIAPEYSALVGGDRFLVAAADGTRLPDPKDGDDLYVGEATFGDPAAVPDAKKRGEQLVA